MHVQNLMNSLWDIRIFLGLVPKESPCTILYCTLLYCTELYCSVLYYTILYCTILYCIVVYYTILYCSVLHYIIFQTPVTFKNQQIGFKLVFQRFFYRTFLSFQKSCSSFDLFYLADRKVEISTIYTWHSLIADLITRMLKELNVFSRNMYYLFFLNKMMY